MHEKERYEIMKLNREHTVTRYIHHRIIFFSISSHIDICETSIVHINNPISKKLFDHLYFTSKNI